LTAVIIQDFKANRGKDYDFDWSRMTNFEGFTGPYLQFAHARLFSIQRKAAEKQIFPPTTLSDWNFFSKSGIQLMFSYG